MASIPGRNPYCCGSRSASKIGPMTSTTAICDHAVADGRNAERPLASVALGYPHAQEGLGDVISRNQLLPQRSQPPLNSLGFDRLERFSVDPRRPGIRPATSVSFQQNVLAIGFVPEGVEAEGWFSLSFRLQRGLELLNGFKRLW